MLIGGTSFRVQLWPEPRTEWAVKFSRNGNFYQAARDRGAAQDRYYGTIRVAGSLTVLDSLQAVLEANRGSITLSGMSSGEMLFGANVDHTGSITATVVNFGMRGDVMNNAIHELEIEVRAISPTPLSTTPSLASLRLQAGDWKGDRSTEINKAFAYNQTPTYLDHQNDVGTFAGRFIQTTEQMQAIRAYLLSTARGNPVTFPALFPNPFHPYGALEADNRFQKCNILSWADKRLNLNRWELQMVLGQALPYFSAGSADSDVDSGAALMSPSDTPAFYAVPGG